MKYKREKKENGFLVLIAVLVSMILLSIGLFIASTSVREIKLSSSLKESQRAFNAADSVTQCALFKEFKGDGFSESKLLDDKHDTLHSLRCNGTDFDWYKSDAIQVSDGAGGFVDHVYTTYFISLAPQNGPEIYYEDAAGDGDGLIDADTGSGELTLLANNWPYVKLIVEKILERATKTIIKVYGHNVKTGTVIVERAIETKY